MQHLRPEGGTSSFASSVGCKQPTADITAAGANSIFHYLFPINYLQMKAKAAGKNTPPKNENLKLRDKSQAISDITHVSQRSYKFAVAPIVKHLNLEVFKLNPCNITKTHNHKHCINYHSNKDRRRYGNFYSPEMCPYIKQEQKCPQGESCCYAHSFVEEHYNYQKYKKYFCFNYPDKISECPYGDFCSYAHNEEEILSTLIHNYAEDEDFFMFYYKTEFCPFNLIKHDPSKCVYAHNWQDYRRKPDHYPYEAIPCYNWKTKDYISIADYNSGCENGFHCNMCHGWKEQQYHPSFYKTVKCETEGCRKGSCPNYHSEKERRVIDNDILSHAFRYVPKNRIVEGVFKNTMWRGELEGKKEKKQAGGAPPSSVAYPKTITPDQNQFKAKTMISVSRQEKSPKKEEIQWIMEKKIIDSEEEESGDDEMVIEQVNRLGLDA